jgi:uncharacterized protein with gpF-like domain
MNWIEIAVYAVASLLFVYVAIDNIRVRMLNKKLTAEILQLLIDKNNLIDEAKRIADMSGSAKSADREGFIKFLSESRDLAFGYIEKFQSSLTKLRNAAKAKDQQLIEQSITELLELLPDETNSQND